MKTKDPLKPKRDRLEQLDIKTILEYVTEWTTHVVAAKRNTGKGLQALINGRYIVDEAQHETLMPVINAGHGKALLFNVAPGETTVEDVVRYMSSIAGDKGFGGPPEGISNGGVVMVRYNKVKKEWDRWFDDLLNGVSLQLNQRSIAQGEFLDAILANEPARLRRSLEFDSTVQGKIAPPPTAGTILAVTKVMSWLKLTFQPHSQLFMAHEAVRHVIRVL